MNRRDFLRAGAAGLAVGTLGRSALAFADEKPKRVGLIGCGWYGKVDILRLMQVTPVEVVSLCDVDQEMLSDAAEMLAAKQASKKKPRTYGDYRKMLAEKDLDIVLVGTPDHWHALPMIAAVEAGADVYVQKPISVDVAEGQAMLAAARKHKRVVQVGTQRRSTPHLVEARNDIIRAGKLGRIASVEIYCYYRGWDQGSPADSAPPKGLDWDMWTGPAPLRPFNEMIHPRGWRSFMEYGNGLLGDMCVHMLDMVRWMLGLGWPKRISSSGGILINKRSKANISDTQVATFDFGDLEVVWQHRSWGDPPDPKYTWGATFYGERGTLKASVFSYDFLPARPMRGGRQGRGSRDDSPGPDAVHRDVTYELEQYPEDKVEPDLERHCAPAIRHHMQDFLAAIASRGRPVADIEEGYISSASCILANLAMKLGHTLEWDPKAGRVVGDEAANALLRRPYRGPWVHP